MTGRPIVRGEILHRLGLLMFVLAGLVASLDRGSPWHARAGWALAAVLNLAVLVVEIRRARS